MLEFKVVCSFRCSVCWFIFFVLVWRGSWPLVDFMLQHNSPFQTGAKRRCPNSFHCSIAENIVEFGCGVGLLSLAFAQLPQIDKLKSRNLLLTDALEKSLQLCKENIALNQSLFKVKTKVQLKKLINFFSLDQFQRVSSTIGLVISCLE